MASANPTRRFEREVPIRFSQCDPAGLIFFPHYLVLFNTLVEDWVTEALGIPYAKLISVRRIGLPIAHLTCDFSAVSRMGDRVTLGLQVARVGGASLTLKLDVRSADEMRVSSGQVLVTTSLDTHRSIAIPADIRTAIAEWQGEMPER